MKPFRHSTRDRLARMLRACADAIDPSRPEPETDRPRTRVPLKPQTVEELPQPKPIERWPGVYL